jgi:DUF2075 family protein
MTPSKISKLVFTKSSVISWASLDPQNSNWPVVYVLDDATGTNTGTKNAKLDDATGTNTGTKNAKLDDVYVGESTNAAGRMRQHLDSAAKQHLRTVRVIVDPTFNKSVCLDLESYLIKLLAGDGSYRVMNRNDGITEADYYDRAEYRESFREVFEQLKNDGVFTRTIPEIENSNLFKLSPFKALTRDQAVAVEGILEGLFSDIASGEDSTTVVQGDPGTGKTVVAIYLLKLLVDIAQTEPLDSIDTDSLFSEFFARGYGALLGNLTIGLVVPQQSLRKSISKVFHQTPGLAASMVMTAFEVGQGDTHYDLLIVDETHRLNQRANQPSAFQNKSFREINEKLFGTDDTSKTQLDWIRAKSKHQVFLVDAGQSVRPADVPREALERLVRDAKSTNRHHPLASQMRVKGGSDYVAYVRTILGVSTTTESLREPIAETFEGYDFRMFTSVAAMHAELREKDDEVGLSRLLAGYAWPWASKKDKTAHDIELDGYALRWNSTVTDWIASPTAIDEVGSIHTVQGYDLNYAGVIIGPDLRYDELNERLVFHRESYFDAKGKENNPVAGKVYTDEDLRQFVSNIYAVLMTRGILGTYVYVCDPALRRYLAKFIPAEPLRLQSS